MTLSVDCRYGKIYLYDIMFSLLSHSADTVESALHNNKFECLFPKFSVAVQSESYKHSELRLQYYYYNLDRCVFLV